MHTIYLVTLSALLALNLTALAAPTDQDFSDAVRLSLQCIEQYEPHEENNMATAEHKKLHPVFWGCYDWHASVFNHWALVRTLNTHPSIPEREAMIRLLDKQFDEAGLEVERKNLTAEPRIVNYELGWFMRLAAEIRVSNLPEAKRWQKLFLPLEQRASEMFFDYLSRTYVPSHSPYHYNTAYAMIHALDYADLVGDSKLAMAIRTKANQFYGKAENCDFELTKGKGFISPCFTIADLMHRLLSADEFEIWFGKFLPNLSKTDLQVLSPVKGDRYGHHAVGLMFQKSVVFSGIASALLKTNPHAVELRGAAQEQSCAGSLTLEEVNKIYNYDASHWLGPFAIDSYSSLR